MEEHDGHAGCADMMTPEERLEAIADLLARGVLRAIEAQRAQGTGAATSAPERAISEAAKEDGP